MADSKLPTELISLLHHIELNKAGWWDAAIQQLIIAVLCAPGAPMTPEEIAKELSKQFSITLNIGRVRKQVKSLRSSDTLLPTGNGKFKLSEVKQRERERELQQAKETVQAVAIKFKGVLKDCCPSLEPEKTWREVNEQLLLPLIRAMGARTYELISAKAINVADIPALQPFLNDYPEAFRHSLRNVITTFLDPKDLDIRTYILSLLNVYFIFEAGNLSETTINAFTKSRTQIPEFIIFVDTNFIFSILGLHENPSNEAAVFLLSLIQQVSRNVSVKLSILPNTADETKRVLAHWQSVLGDLRPASNIFGAAASGDLGGIAYKYVEEMQKSNFSITAESYFGPYIRDLMAILRSKGVELINENVALYKQSRPVMDDISQQQDWERERPERRDKLKSYDLWEHDMVLWHFTRDKRPPIVESPLEAKYWVLTLDLGFTSFDRSKNRRAITQARFVPICLDPTALIQMLQFWVPRTLEFDQAMVVSLRLPLLFQEFDPIAEKAAINILAAMSRYENVGDLTTEAIRNVLWNEALRGKISVEPDEEKRGELIREALIEEFQKSEKELTHEKERGGTLEATIVKLNIELAEAVRSKKSAVESNKSLEDRIRELESIAKTKEDQEVTRKQIRGFTIKFLVLPLFANVPLSYLCAFVLNRLTNWQFLLQASVFFYVLFVIPWAWFVDRHGSNNIIVKEWRLFKLFQKFKGRLFVALTAITLGLIVATLFDWLKTHLWF